MNDEYGGYRKSTDKKYYEALKLQLAEKDAKMERKELLREKKEKFVKTGIIKLVNDKKTTK